MDDLADSDDFWDRVEAACGPEVAEKLCEAYGGREVYLPHYPRDRDSLSRIIGLDAAKVFSQRIGGGKMTLPAGAARARRRRNALILTRRNDGASSNAIAAELHLHKRTVERVLSALQKEGALS